MNNFNEIYSVYFSDVYKYVLLLCRDENIAEEITQETFFKALKHIHKFKGDCKLSVWLCQIAKNTYYTAYMKEKKFKREEMSEVASDCDDFQEKLIDKEIATKVHKALHNLKEPYKEVFSLRVFGELSFHTIAEIFEKNESWARVTYHRAKTKLKEVIHEKSG